MVESFKILIVDDEPSIVVPLQFLMEKNGYRVLTAADGEEAIRISSSDRPDLILLDIMLPVRDGYEVCQAVRENPETRHSKIVFITAMGREVDLAKGRAYGADAYITKPFANADVLATVKSLLG
ncbi:MAG: response regulator [Desulfobacteraceae bacterium]|nr:response regulator [Desulfobacteraceae bacterium]